MHPDWVRSLRDQCQAAGVPFFFKQWGEYQPYMEGCGYAWVGNKEPTEFDGATLFKVGKKKAGRLLDGQVWDQFPEVKQ